MNDPFEYDVFLSFLSTDEQIVKLIWQELCSNGLMVFWSEATLKKEVGNSWFDIIEHSLERSKHMILVCSQNSVNSKWVKREYKAFFDYCYSPGKRRLIPLLIQDFKASDLPLFLRELQVGKIDDNAFIHEIIPLLDRVNIEKLLSENQELREEIDLLMDKNNELTEQKTLLARATIVLDEKVMDETNKNQSLSQGILAVHAQLEGLAGENCALRAQVNSLSNENVLLAGRLKDETTKASLLTQGHLVTKEALDKLSDQNSLLREQINSLTNENASLVERLTTEARKPRTLAREYVEAMEQRNSLLKENNLLKERLAEDPQRNHRIGWPRLVVCNLAEDVSSNDLWVLYSTAGAVKLSQIIKGENDRSLGFGLIVMSSYEESEKAINLFHGKDVGGRPRPLSVYRAS